MDIEFQPSTGLGTKQLAHMLDFNDKGNTQSILLEVEDDGTSEAIARSLVEQLDKLKLEDSKQ